MKRQTKFNASDYEQAAAGFDNDRRLNGSGTRSPAKNCGG